MAISPISGMGLVLAAVPSNTTAENLEKTIAKLEKQREEYKLHSDAQDNNRTIKNLEERLNNLENRLSKLKERQEEQDGECQTCANRKYQDGSDDPGVSFKTATAVAKGAAEAAVRGHEQEHVVREQYNAEKNGLEVVSQNVRIKYAICPECGDSYCAGGVTTTVTRPKTESPLEVSERAEQTGQAENPEKKALENRFAVGVFDKDEEYGKLLNTVA
ncbi:MAG: hypothetical protein J1F28_02190 [Oscillospiraceae bacterium]|nr:hypothetical protein [Oscillospiraceae bacterium]